MYVTSSRFRSVLISCGCLCFLLSCANAAGARVPAKVPTPIARLGRPFDLRARHEVIVQGENLRVEFISVKDDSRCPTDVTCIWAGNAAVLFDVSIRGKSGKRLLLNTNSQPSLPNEDKYRGYRVKLVRLKPYPRSGRRIWAGEYVATLVVTKE